MDSAHISATSQIATPNPGVLTPVQLTTQNSQAVLNKITAKYGPWCSESVGAAKIAALPKITAMQLNLRGESSYYSCRVTPEHLGNVSAARYKDSMGRRGLAVRCIDEDGVEFVELIFQRYSWDKDNYVTALSNRGTDGRIYNSHLYASGGMSKPDLKRVGDLLDGEAVRIRNYMSIKMAEPRELTSAERILLIFGNDYGSYCCNIIGIEALDRLPVLSTEELGLDLMNGDLKSMSNLDVLQGHSAVRFVNKERGGPGIAIHVRQFNKIDKTFVDSVEFIYSRDGYPIRWKSTSSCLLDDSKNDSSKVSLEKVRDLLQGKKVTSKTADGITLQMVQPALPSRKARPRGVTFSVGGRFPDSVYRALR